MMEDRHMNILWSCIYSIYSKKL